MPKVTLSSNEGTNKRAVDTALNGETTFKTILATGDPSQIRTAIVALTQAQRLDLIVGLILKVRQQDHRLNEQERLIRLVMSKLGVS